MSMQPVPWPEPDPQIATAIKAMYGSRKRERPLAVEVRDRLGQWLADEDFAAAFGIRDRPGWPRAAPFGRGVEIPSDGRTELTLESPSPLTGYRIINADSLEEAESLVRGMPVIESVRVCEAHSMYEGRAMQDEPTGIACCLNMQLPFLHGRLRR
jgi:hypothetical protein